MQKNTEVRFSFEGAWGECEDEAAITIREDGIDISTYSLGHRFSSISLTYPELCTLVHELEYLDFKKRAAAQRREKTERMLKENNG